jgi:hypothetical protein
MAKLSILIPARNEMFLNRTIEDILSNIEDDTEIIVGLDGQWPEVPIPQDKRVHVVYYNKSIGQRAMTNQLCKMSSAKYVMKVDAHCAFDKGFDRKLTEVMKDNWMLVPTMRNLHAFDWVCEDGHRRYQGPSGVCKECGKETIRDMVWIAKTKPESRSYCFDSEPHFQYFNAYTKREGKKPKISESMSVQGSCFMVTRQKYWELRICDESFGSWGSQGIEVACKTWLSGGKVKIHRDTWYAHLFRTQGGDFSFPYPQRESKVQEAKTKARDLFFKSTFPQQIYPLSWLIERFYPVNGWSDKDIEDLKTMEIEKWGNEVIK